MRRQFVANQDAANKHFKGKHVEWAGTISSTAQRLAMEEGLFAVLHPDAGKKDTAFIAFFDNDMRDVAVPQVPRQHSARPLPRLGLRASPHYFASRCVKYIKQPLALSHRQRASSRAPQVVKARASSASSIRGS